LETIFMRRFSVWSLGVSIMAMLMLFSLGGRSAKGQETDQQANEADARVARLIEQLGADDYATREKAQTQLKALGLSAFDALLAAANHDDIEIASRVRYLTGQLGSRSGPAKRQEHSADVRPNRSGGPHQSHANARRSGRLDGRRSAHSDRTL
jgi:(p)ppGpp synthase/HD superfamily hydrolase